MTLIPVLLVLMNAAFCRRRLETGIFPFPAEISSLLRRIQYGASCVKRFRSLVTRPGLWPLHPQPSATACSRAGPVRPALAKRYGPRRSRAGAGCCAGAWARILLLELPPGGGVPLDPPVGVSLAGCALP